MPPTAAAASSSAPGPLFKTPTSNLGTNGGSQHPEKRKLGGHGPTLADEVEHLLPTPAARDWKSGESNLIGTNSRPLNEVVVNLLPTPTASNPNDGESLESWEARRQRNLAKGVNGNGQGTPLAIAVKLLPTPMAGDSKGTRNATAGRTTDNPNVNAGWTLSDVIFDGQLSNPPAPPADAKSPSTTPEASAPAAADAPIPNSGGPMKLLPTPDTGMSPNGHGRRGGKPGNGHQSGASLDNVVKDLLPTPTGSDGERKSSSYGRGNPTSTGAITSLPSGAGNESSDDEPLGLLTFWDD
ncbi:hypothetical protein ABZT06_08630 [Streptomyces sp. NPDC005483]|uniref:hypothetical protein n=1 Tax=Streptomyces sp. NPDC005483 TaxID=3154882 RepID=UPI0033A3F494